MRLIRFERKNEPLASHAAFLGRIARGFVVALVLIALALAAGMAGYNAFEGTDWITGFENAAMLLGGMGPVVNPVTDAGKLFAGAYALVCGLVLVAVSGIILAPALHRLLHSLHVDDADK